MRKIDITICQAQDGFYSAYCNDHPALFGSGDTPEAAKAELQETLRITKEEIGRDAALIYPDWLDEAYEFVTHWDVQTMLQYYAGVITPAALGRLSGIHPGQIWAYMHGESKPRKANVDKIAAAVHKLGHELVNTSF